MIRLPQLFFFLMIRRPPRSTLDRSSAASDVYKRQVWVYQYVNGVWQNTDLKSDTTPGNRFGAALDVAGDFYVAGIPGWDGSALPADQNLGQVVTYNRCNAPNPNNWCGAYSHGEGALSTNARLGAAVAIAGERVIIGAPVDSPNNVADAGSAWIDNLLASGPVTTPIKLTDPTPAANEFFGSSVAGAGTVFAVGSRIDDEPMGAADSGAVHIFALSGNTAPFEATLRSPAPQTGAEFGTAIALTLSLIHISEPTRLLSI